MPESKTRASAKQKLKRKHAAEAAEERADRQRLTGPHRDWVPWVALPVGLLGVIWMVVYNLAGSAIGFLRVLGDWNVVIGLGLIIVSFSLMTLWK